ncbi:MAG TPA: UDP-N-acetylmuramoyl-L-alanyl-D-glutamate--2,6-diaminopimelate ligase [Candidatus Sulfotelmatobacter sp.]|nr:UDP-N-acetylmuramoyl-L-alanyl-D-glutamate--2,6-diaminopimelate ligase [Candidatus Sulfotelmatobacter sp.]
MWQKVKNVYHLLVAILANFIFLFPARRIKVVAVTGTDGKTTTVNLIYHILKTAGKKVSMISSINAVIGGKVYDTGFHVTTPSSFALQRFLRRSKSEYFVLEVTSHAIDQNRIFGVPVSVGVITNVTNEHLDYHKTYDNYLKTKASLLKKAKTSIVNTDDISYTLLSDVKNKKLPENWVTYGMSEVSDYNPKTFDIGMAKLVGDFNKYNVLASVSAAKSLGIPDETIKKALSSFHMPIGRVDYVYKKDFSIMIDFAHTPNAFKKILSTVKPLTKGRIIHVFGSAGQRDVLKRPFLGELSSTYSDIVILTAEDPRSEDVNKIIAEIEIGIKREECEVIRIPDRKEAIEAAVQMAKKGDLVLITGKAQEGSMTTNQKELPWDEFAVVEKALSNRG